jgi:primosomal protein N' (replication factor Y)
MFVKVPFRESTLVGCVTGVKKSTSLPASRIKTVNAVIDHVAAMDTKLLELGRWISGYYGCPLGMIVRSMIPSYLFRKPRKRAEPSFDLSDSPKTEPGHPFALNRDQKKALDAIAGHMDDRMNRTFLLWGVTGSGKTEVYLRAIQRARKKGRSAVVIVPEIALTPQLREHFRVRFREPVAVFHSRLSAAERASNWRSVASGAVRIVLGARSAVFAPVRDLGILVVDEEHERTYKQEETPRYHARDIAVVRGSLEKAAVVLCSATPSLESYHNCVQGKYELLRLPARVSGRPMPGIEMVDMERESADNPHFLFSRKLLAEIERRLARKEQSVLFMNRRGFAPCRICSRCGEPVRCDACSILMTFHRSQNRLVCHRCHTERVPGRSCPRCGKGPMRFLGFGTEKVEKIVRSIFPAARVARIDSDNVKKKGHLETVWGEFKKGGIDILIGTQMIAKGLHVENVTLVGVLSADLALNLPDFRAGEQTFQLITQVSGRAGRGDKPGTVVVQTHSAGHPVLEHALSQDFPAFFDMEIALRKTFHYPPWSRLILVTVSDRDEKRAARTAHDFYRSLVHHPEFSALRSIPPVPAPIAKIRGKYRFQILVASRTIRKCRQSIQETIRRHHASRTAHFSVDVDPYSML